MLEKDFLKLIYHLLSANGNIVFPQNSRVTHGNTRYRPGTPDLLVMSRKGKFYGIELKVKSGLTPLQKTVQLYFKMSGFEQRYIVATPENYKTVLKGLLK